MSWLSQWLKEIIMVILLATFIDLLMPNRSMQRYIKLTLSLIILLILLSPIMKLFHTNITEDVAKEWRKASLANSSAFTSLTSIQREAAKLTAERTEQARQFASEQLESNMKERVNQLLADASWSGASSQGEQDISVFASQGLYFKTDRMEVQLEQDSVQGEPKIRQVQVHLHMTKENTSRQDGVESRANEQSPMEVQPVQAVPEVNIGAPETDQGRQAPEKLTKEARTQAMQQVEEIVIKQLTTEWLVTREQIIFVWADKK